MQPLIDNPTTCSGGLTARLTVQTYQDPEHPTTEPASYPATTNCDLEVFNPVLYASPTTAQTDSPSGLNLDLSAPQFLGRAASPSELKKAVVTFPEGFTINPMPPTVRRCARKSRPISAPRDRPTVRTAPRSAPSRLEPRRFPVVSKGPSTSANLSPANSTVFLRSLRFRH